MCDVLPRVDDLSANSISRPLSKEIESRRCRSSLGWPEVRRFSGRRKEAPQVFQSPIMSKAWSLYRRLANRGRDKIAPETRAEFTLGISSPYIWASTGNATIVSCAIHPWNVVPGQYFTGLARLSSCEQYPGNDSARLCQAGKTNSPGCVYVHLYCYSRKDSCFKIIEFLFLIFKLDSTCFFKKQQLKLF